MLCPWIFFGLKFNMEFLKLRTSKISICKEHIIQGPPVQLYRDNLRTHVPMCEDYLQKGKKLSRNRKERQNGKLIQDCCKRCRSEFGTNGSNKRLSLFYCKASTVLFMTKFCTKYWKHWCYFSSHRFICLARDVALPFSVTGGKKKKIA